MRALGSTAMPAYATGYTFGDIQNKCEEYAQKKAIDDFRTSGTVSDLNSVESDVEACADQMDRSRQLRQGLILTASLVGIGFLGHFLWQKLS